MLPLQIVYVEECEEEAYTEFLPVREVPQTPAVQPEPEVQCTTSIEKRCEQVEEQECRDEVYNNNTK